MRNNPNRRAGFTLVEMLVAAAVSIMLMLILTEAFKQGLDMFRRLRAQGNLMTRLREASTTIRDDLTAPHFPNYQDPNHPYLSQQDLTNPNWTPPNVGYFRIMQGPEPLNAALGAQYANNPFVFEGTDPETIMYTRATNHMMSFTALRGGSGPDDMFRTLEPTRNVTNGNPPTVFPRDWIQPQDYRDNVTTFSTRWADITYFMANTGQTTKPTTANPNGLPLFDLCRRVGLLVPLVGNNDGSTMQAFPPYPNDNPDLSTTQKTAPPVRLNRVGWSVGNISQPEVTQPLFRFGMQAGNPAGIPAFQDPVDQRMRPRRISEEYPNSNQNRWGDDVLLNDVISFEIKAVWANQDNNNPPDPVTGPSQGGNRQGNVYTWNVPGLGQTLNTDYPFDYLPTSQWANNPPPAPPSNTGFAIGGGRSYRVFDTWSANGPYTFDWKNQFNTRSLPLKIRIKALQIRIRVWDRKSEQTRQITIVQDM